MGTLYVQLIRFGKPDSGKCPAAKKYTLAHNTPSIGSIKTDVRAASSLHSLACHIYRIDAKYGFIRYSETTTSATTATTTTRQREVLR